MNIKTVLFLSTVSLVFNQVLGDLEADITAADAAVNKTFLNAESLQYNIAGFRKVLYSDIVPYATDIKVRMYALGIDSDKIEELSTLYRIYMNDTRPIIDMAISDAGYAYLFPTSKTSFDIRNNINSTVLTEDVNTMESFNNRYKEDFAYYVNEIDWRITDLFVKNWLLIQGTSGPDREAIDEDRDYIYNATTGYRDQLKEHMVTVDQDSKDGCTAVNIVISQLP